MRNHALFASGISLLSATALVACDGDEGSARAHVVAYGASSGTPIFAALNLAAS